MATAIALNHVTKLYGGKAAVQDLSLEVQAGEVLGLLGSNGAGKSTTLYMLSRLVHPTSGEISIFGKDLQTQWLQVAPRIGVVVERPAFPPHLSAAQILRMHARLAGHETNIDRVLDMAGLLQMRDVRAGHLSHGMRQRLALALALLTEPRLLILDEPTSGLDPESGAQLLEWLRQVVVDAKVTLIFSTHLMQEVELLCDKVAVLNEGRLVSLEDANALLGYDARHVEVMVDAAENAAKRLIEQPWVMSAIPKSGRVIVRLRESGPYQLNAFLVNNGFVVSGLIPRRRSLQEYLLKVTNRDSAEIQA